MVALNNMFGMSKLYVKHSKRILLVCLILVSIHVFYLVHRNKWALNLVSIKNEGYRLIKYFENSESGLMVVEKSYKVSRSEAGRAENEDEGINNNRFNIETIEGYKYDKQQAIDQQQKILQENASVRGKDGI